MSILARLADDAVEYARREIEEFKMPSSLQFELSLEKAIWISEIMKADTDIVRTGLALMDLKLGEAASQGKQSEHVAISKASSIEFLKNYDVDETIKSILLNCVEAHHGALPFTSIEAEICANGDCYRFIHPKGVLCYIGVLDKRLNDFSKVLDQVEAKMDEKMEIASIPFVVEELQNYYGVFKHYIKLAR
jgi:hypothetical protein